MKRLRTDRRSMISVMLLDPQGYVVTGHNPFAELTNTSVVIFRRRSLAQQWSLALNPGVEHSDLQELLTNATDINELVRVSEELRQSRPLVYATDWDAPETDDFIGAYSGRASIRFLDSNRGKTNQSRSIIRSVIEPASPLLTIDSLQFITADTRRPFDGGSIPLNPSVNCIIHSVDSFSLDAIERQITRMFGSESRVILVDPALNQTCHTTSGNWRNEWAENNSVIVLPCVPELDRNRSVQGFQHIIARLRAPGGCPWDRQQSNESMAASLLEETCELVDAIETHDVEHMREELGDLLLQVMMHSQISEEQDNFSFEDVVQTVNEKIIRRHPHVFEDVTVDSADEVVVTWDEIKRKEREEATRTISPLGDIPSSLPGLMRTLKVLKRSIRAGLLIHDIQKSDQSSERNKADSDIERDLFLLILRAFANDQDLEKIARLLSRRLEKWITEPETNESDKLWNDAGLKRNISH